MTLSEDTRNLLRTLGTVALRLADDRLDDPTWLRSQLGKLPVDRARTAARSELLTIPEACERLRLSRWSIYQLIHRRELTSIKIGRRRFISTAEVDRFVANLADGGRS
ncbi:helix-turn-helix domain-containing protein [Nocardia mangyaensis]|uniref:helix-turn-helix domain-containing protein n=1 Tax=Nocardia mangyaensis TaxID=2213200 RepID=UPI002676F866|nr:helix-turn-helix domain-containing protein [Nocardia mangyaensis]MDO3645654.1 helix-turn-helix domain-containing protein [Nocardia mangyaensis]